MSPFKIRKRLSKLIKYLNTKLSANKEKESELRLANGKEGVVRIISWLKATDKDFDMASIASQGLGISFAKQCILETYQRLTNAGWEKHEILNMKMAEIYPLVLNHQTTILNNLSVDGNELLPDRSIITYDLIVYVANNIDPNDAENQLNPYWPDYFNTTLRAIWT